MTQDIDHSASGARRSDRTRAVILDAARRRFAAHGFERTTIRAVAADAGIDPSMVMRYYGSKDRLFDAALDIDLDLPDLSAVPAGERAEALVRHFLRRWERDEAGDALLLLLRSAVTNEHAAGRMHAIFATQVAPALAGAAGPEQAARAEATGPEQAAQAEPAGPEQAAQAEATGPEQTAQAEPAGPEQTARAEAAGPEQAARAGLVSAQLLGLALTRYILRIPAVAHLSPEQIVATLAPAVQATLDGPAPDRTTAREG
ncbi:TetR family transcriptional regulator [Streptomyces sp. NPDC056738]|uniref:TetR/AcrR family transcriptional regulator n=1 Tax=Streptomyces sp. NPDC056738 TaxID=3345933 RepID=UPI003678E2FF